ncbi:hypothetical protein NQ318_004534 [Aromia moschata]|uniref:DDE-1 domain-containing protein n=1 Tax=Aromia moschata TaxID=1265417 RepID=A0AAV8X0E3_9CUCU|nr:hypothetical protein NQ318_004534 [Aromia moschata]
MACENFVSIVCIPPHCSHKMQPLVISFMGPLKTYYAKEIENWFCNNPDRVVTVYQVGELFGRAYLRTATAEIAAHGFRKPGLYPCNRNVFRAHDFLIIENNESDVSAEVKDIQLTNKGPQPNVTTMDTENRPGCSHEGLEVLPKKQFILPADFSPPPKLKPKVQNFRTGSAQTLKNKKWLNEDDTASLLALHSVREAPRLSLEEGQLKLKSHLQRIFKQNRILPFKPKFRHTLEEGDEAKEPQPGCSTWADTNQYSALPENVAEAPFSPVVRSCTSSQESVVDAQLNRTPVEVPRDEQDLNIHKFPSKGSKFHKMFLI